MLGSGYAQDAPSCTAAASAAGVLGRQASQPRARRARRSVSHSSSLRNRTFLLNPSRIFLKKPHIFKMATQISKKRKVRISSGTYDLKRHHSEHGLAKSLREGGWWQMVSASQVLGGNNETALRASQHQAAVEMESRNVVVPAKHRTARGHYWSSCECMLTKAPLSNLIFSLPHFAVRR